MGVTTKQKLEFVHAMAQRTRATVRQCEALMRYATMLRTLAESDAAKPDFTGSTYRLAHIQRKVTELCHDISERDHNRPEGVHPVFAGPVLKIRMPNGGEEVEVPS